MSGGSLVDPWWNRSGSVVDPPMNLVDPGASAIPALCVFTHSSGREARPTSSFIKLKGTSTPRGAKPPRYHSTPSRILPKPCYWFLLSRILPSTGLFAQPPLRSSPWGWGGGSVHGVGRVRAEGVLVLWLSPRTLRLVHAFLFSRRASMQGRRLGSGLAKAATKLQGLNTSRSETCW